MLSISLTVAALSISSIVALSAARPAQALVDPKVDDYIAREFIDQTVEGSPTRLLDSQCSAVCRGHLGEEAGLPSTFKSKLTRLRRLTKLTPSLRYARTLSVWGAGATAASYFLVQVGEKVIKVAKPMAAGGAFGNAQRLDFTTRGWPLPLGGTPSETMPVDGWVWTQNVRTLGWVPAYTKYSGECVREPFDTTPPAGMTVVTGPAQQCTYYDTPLGGSSQSSFAYVAADDLDGAATLEDRTSGMTFDAYIDPGTWPDAVRNRAEAKTRTETELATGAYPELTSLAAHDGDPEGYPDPTKPTFGNPDHHRCDLSQPAFKAPTFFEPADPFAQVGSSYVTIVRPPDLTGADATTPVALREGYARYRPGGAQDDFPGWGLRHIKAKHGWGPKDEAATRAAMQTGFPTIAGTTVTYDGAVRPSPDGRSNCQRHVVVQFKTMSEAGETKPKGIITSYEAFKGAR